MIEVVATREINADIETVWNILADFANLYWIPGIDKVEQIGEGIGMIRRMTMGPLPPIDEVLKSIDTENRKLSYTMPKNDLNPFDQYLAHVALTPLDGSVTRINWSCTFEPENMSEAMARDLIENNYKMVIDGLENAACGK